MTLRKIIKDRRAVSNQLIIPASVGIFILIILAALTNTVTMNHLEEPVVEKKLIDQENQKIMNFLTDQGVSSDGSDQWYADILKVIPSEPESVGLKMNSDDLSFDIAELTDSETQHINQAPYAPSNPFPADNEGSASTDSVLMWDCDDPDIEDFGDAITYTIYIGENNLPSSPTASDFTTAEYDFTLEEGKTYKWKVVAKDSCGLETEGPVWTFSTTAPPANNDPELSPLSNDEIGRNIDGTYTFSATDDDGDNVRIRVNWGDGTESDSGWIAEGSNYQVTNKWLSEDLFNVQVSVTDANSARDSGDFDVNVVNNPPNIGGIHAPPELGVYQEYDSFASWALDPNEDQVRFRFNWGDSTGSSWCDYVDSEEWSYPFSHSWSSTGTYTITVFSEDEYGRQDTDTTSISITTDDNDRLPQQPCCFPAGTKISMADGSYKNIENIKSGDIVLSYDLEKDRYVTASVSNKIIREREAVYDINDGLLSPTNDHPLYVRKSDGRLGWAAVDPTKSKVAYKNRDCMSLELGDKIFNGAEWINVELIECKPGLITTYTFTVSKYHVYFANGILVSNTVDCDPNIWEDDECFVAGTLISMSDGSYKPIETIVVGDTVLSYNFDKDVLEGKKVIKTISPYHDDIVEFVFSNSVFSRHTFDHPYYVLGKGWSSFRPSWTKRRYNIDTEKIEIGDIVFTDKGEKVQLVEINTLNMGLTKTYNFYVEENHNYYADGILVHNKDDEGNAWSCFPSGTMISMADGSYKAIENVDIGDSVLSYDFGRGRNIAANVLELEAPIRDHMCRLIFDDGSDLELTEEHPVYTRDGWKSIDPTSTLEENPNLNVGKLIIGDSVLFSDSEYQEIVNIERWEEIIQTYNLKSVEGYHNFYADGILVHNKDADEDTRCCFPAGTLITLSNNNTVPIEKIRRGHRVLSYDFEKGNLVSSKVKSTLMPVREGVYDINDGLLSPTCDHPLYVYKPDIEYEGWAAVDPISSINSYPNRTIKKLAIGDMLFTLDGWIEIKSIEYHPGRLITYTLNLEENNQFFANNVLVSNAEFACEDGTDKCFLGGTKIKMADGTLKSIEDVKVGDKIETYDELSEEFTTDEIVDVYHYTADTLKYIGNYYLKINEKILVTPDHPLYINNEWKLAEDLEIGDVLTSGENIYSIEEIHDPVKTYNLHTKTYHNYIVVYGDEDQYVIAHNADDYYVGGNEEESVDSDDYQSLILDWRKAQALKKLDYNTVKNSIFASDYDFIIKIKSLDGDETYLDYPSEEDLSISLDQADYVSIQKVNALLCDPNSYEYSRSSETYYFYDYVTLELKVL